MQSNVHSPYYFSGQDSSEKDQWALVNRDKNFILVDQNFKLIKYTQLIFGNGLELVRVSSLPNFVPLDNTKCLLMGLRNNKLSTRRSENSDLSLQELLLFIRSVVWTVVTELEFHATHMENLNADAKQALATEQEFFQITNPNDPNIAKLYSTEIGLLDAYIEYSNQIKSLILNLLMSCISFSDQSLTAIKNKFFTQLDQEILSIDYFNYVKTQLNKLC